MVEASVRFQECRLGENSRSKALRRERFPDVSSTVLGDQMR